MFNLYDKFVTNKYLSDHNYLFFKSSKISNYLYITCETYSELVSYSNYSTISFKQYDIHNPKENLCNDCYYPLNIRFKGSYKNENS